MSDAEAFEAALRANPDDLAGWCAFADYLMEHDDPRGEFMRVQIALEDESRSKDERDALKEREKELLAKHEREWLGELAPHIAGREITDMSDPNYDWDRPETPEIQYRWRWGILYEITVQWLTVKLAQTLADAPATRLLQKFHVVGTAEQQDETTPRRNPGPPDNRGYDEYLELFDGALLRSLRVFQMGDPNGEPPEGYHHNHTYVPSLEQLVAQMTCIEELHLLCKDYDSAALFALSNLTNLRVLRMDALGNPHGGDNYEIPLDVLANNPAIGNLTHLMLHPHYGYRSFIPLRRVRAVFRSRYLKKLAHLQLRLSDMGDAGIREIIKSGILKQLNWLDLRHGCVTDEGARLLAANPDAKRLERIDLSRNAVTASGLAALRAANVNAVANNPLTQSELDEREYLREGDFE